MDKTVIEVNDISVSYRVQQGKSIKSILNNGLSSSKKINALKDITFSVKKGKIVGIVGKNGSGKSTLLRAICNIFGVDKGTIDLHGNKVSLISIGVGFNDRLTGRENIILSGLLLGFSKEEIERRMPTIIEFSEIGEFIDYPVSSYSSGMYSKLAFSVYTQLDTDIILIDEVLAVGDEHFARKSYNEMKKLIEDDNHTVVIVSHNLNTIEDLCDEVLWIHEGNMKAYGKTEDILPKYKEFMS